MLGESLLRVSLGKSRGESLKKLAPDLEPLSEKALREVIGKRVTLRESPLTAAKSLGESLRSRFMSSCSVVKLFCTSNLPKARKRGKNLFPAYVEPLSGQAFSYEQCRYRKQEREGKTYFLV
jgi:hypothetical protein